MMEGRPTWCWRISPSRITILNSPGERRRRLSHPVKLCCTTECCWPHRPNRCNQSGCKSSVYRMSECADPIVGKILAGWRYDISSLAPEMRGDYEQHLAACELCRSRQSLH